MTEIRQCECEYMALELNANGEVVHVCDSLVGLTRQCECEGFQE